VKKVKKEVLKKRKEKILLQEANFKEVMFKIKCPEIKNIFK